MTRRRVAILGAGIGAQHLDGFVALPDHFEVALICDRDVGKGHALANRVPGCFVAGDASEAVADPQIDIIDICLPPHLHGPIAIESLAAGKHVVCEKPFAGSVREADAMARAASKAGRLLMPIFQYRYGRSLEQLKALQEAGLTGKPYVGTCETHWDRGADYYAVPWRGSWEHERGGAMLGHAIHIHDLAARIFGPAIAVSAHIDTRVNDIETEDCAAIAMTMESGALVTSSTTLGAAGDTTRLRLVFENLTVESGRNPYAPGQDQWDFVARDPGNQQKLDTVVAATSNRLQGYAGQFAALAAKLDGADSDIVTPQDGVRSLEIVAAAYLSAREGRRVDLPLDRGHPICSDWTPAHN